MEYFVVEFRHGENKQIWIAFCEAEAETMILTEEVAQSSPNARAEVEETLSGVLAFLLKPDMARLWLL